MKVAQAVALQEGRTYVIPDDVRLLRHGVLRHRLVLTYDALADGVAPDMPVAVLERAGAVHFKRAALAMLRERADAVTPAASETVRTT